MPEDAGTAKPGKRTSCKVKEKRGGCHCMRCADFGCNRGVNIKGNDVSPVAVSFIFSTKIHIVHEVLVCAHAI